MASSEKMNYKTEKRNTMSEYVQMLVSAGWVQAESLDEDYQAYRKRANDAGIHPFEVMDYQDWKSEVTRWEDLNRAFTTEIEHIPYDDLTPLQKIRERELLQAMSRSEFHLCY